MIPEPNKDGQNPEQPSPEEPTIRVGGRTDHLPPIQPYTQDTQASEPIKGESPKKEEGSSESVTFPTYKPDPTRDTAVLSENNPLLKRMIRSTAPAGTTTLGMGREVILVIRGMVERIVMDDNKVYKLGRFEMASRKSEEIDLSPYGALDRGVSRLHAQLQLNGENLYITDLNSTNGTYLAGQRLKPNESTILRKGDELLIGRLPLQVLFR